MGYIQKHMASSDQNEVHTPSEIWDKMDSQDIAIAYLNSSLTPENPTSSPQINSIESYLEGKADKKYEVAENMLTGDTYTTMGSPQEIPEGLSKFIVDGLTNGFETDDNDLKRQRLAKITGSISGQISFEGSFIKGKDLETFATNIESKIDTGDPEIKTFWDKLQGDIKASREDFGTYGEAK